MGAYPPDDSDQPWTRVRGAGYWRSPSPRQVPPPLTAPAPRDPEQRRAGAGAGPDWGPLHEAAASAASEDDAPELPRLDQAAPRGPAAPPAPPARPPAAALGPYAEPSANSLDPFGRPLIGTGGGPMTGPPSPGTAPPKPGFGPNPAGGPPRAPGAPPGTGGLTWNANPGPGGAWPGQAGAAIGWDGPGWGEPAPAGAGRPGAASGSATPYAGWGGMYGRANRALEAGGRGPRRRTWVTLVGIALAAAMAITLIRFVWDLGTPDRLAVPLPQNVAVQANGLPEGYQYAASTGGRGDELICGPIAWETRGELPPGGLSAVEEAVDLLGQMTGLSVRPRREVDLAAVRITFEFVSQAELAAAAGGGGEAIGLAMTTHGAAGIYGSEILLSQPYFEAALRLGSDDGVLVVLHELGHALGLDHSVDPKSLMYPELSDKTRITDADVVAFNTAAPDC